MPGKKGAKRTTISDRYGGNDPSAFAAAFDRLAWGELEEHGITSGLGLHKAAKEKGVKISEDTCNRAFKKPHDMTLTTASKLSTVIDITRITRQAVAERLDRVDTESLVRVSRKYNDAKTRLLELADKFLQLDEDRQQYVLESVRGLSTGVQEAACANACLALRLQLNARMMDADIYDDDAIPNC